MKAMKTPGNKLNAKRLFLIIAFAISLTIPAVSFAQEEAKKDTAINKTMKSVFSEAKKLAKKDDSNLGSILMIAGIICIVGVAVWLSFRPDEYERKKQKKAPSA